MEKAMYDGGGGESELSFLFGSVLQSILADQACFPFKS